MLFGNPDIPRLERQLARRRMLRERPGLIKKQFWPLRHTLMMRSKKQLYGRFLRQANTDWISRPPGWFVGHPDWPEATRIWQRRMEREQSSAPENGTDAP